MTRYRKLPVVIDAHQWQPEHDLPEWLNDAVNEGTVGFAEPHDDALSIKTLEGTMRAEVGDWIIKGVKGEIYPCKPDIFAATYEEAP